jgi:peptidoglycan/xylan/chitin deacetylase (PgdA/CDA1 family)
MGIGTIYIVFGVLGVLGFCFVAPYWARNYYRQKFLTAVKENGFVCLTFDDGPNPESTPEILNLLKELDITATFFLIGRNIQKYPELCRQIIDHNHEVGDHGYKHLHPWKSLPFCAVIDLVRGSLAVKKHTNGTPFYWLRPPYGKLNSATLCYVWLCRRKLAFWNVDPQDYRPQPPEQLAASVLKHFRGGSVILLHERSLHTNEALEGNLAAIKMMVQEIQKRGYTFTKVSEAVAAAT